MRTCEKDKGMLLLLDLVPGQGGDGSEGTRSKGSDLFHELPTREHVPLQERDENLQAE